ncbi:hypothetical protein F5X68DRAFT_252439 [Neofusicoccum parvum]|uniref:Uncharacterized protein n=1 Tax=Neofusicoccum parvum TaxID=310453 RepID=A0ACB5S7M6_9PEZI|nr:hypothetical protein F5X68DRAFT_252439 [Neofusicoccum parvum]
MQDYGEHSQRDVRQLQASVSWLVLYYPLNPYFVIFCNVITISDADDLALLRGVTDNLNVFVTNRRRGNPAIEGVRRLFHAFVQLCVPRAGRSLDALEEQELVRCLRDSQLSLQWLEPDQLSGFTL